MLIKRAADIRSSEITDKKQYLNRRAFIQAATGTVAAAAANLVGGGELHAAKPAPHGRKLENVKKSAFSTARVDLRPKLEARAVDDHGGRRVQQAGFDEPRGRPQGKTLEERIYRHRCVERWSMAIPWVGFPLSDFIKQCDPTSKAKYVEFTTLNDPKQMPGVRSSEIMTGLLFLLPRFRPWQARWKARILLLACSSLFLEMLVAIYVHLQPGVPREVLPLGIKPPVIPLFVILLDLMVAIPSWKDTGIARA